MNKYIKSHYHILMIIIILCLIYNFYFIFLVPQRNLFYIYYIDFLIIVCSLCFFMFDFIQFIKTEKYIQAMLQHDHIIYHEIDNLSDKSILDHDIKIMQKQYNEQFQINCDLQDYIARWCHEIKLPLSALLLMNEKIENQELRILTKDQLEKIRQQLNASLIGCKVQSRLYDLQMKEVSLNECLTTSIKNNQYFLIQKHFVIDLQDSEETVYTDKEWLVYVLDQLISNAIKYCQDHPKLKITYHKKERDTQLIIEDNGTGIQKSDIRNIFERGFTGHNHHNGQYKSTGMGLYFVDMILKKLNHTITVESEYGKYTRFIITFQDNRDYFQL